MKYNRLKYVIVILAALLLFLKFYGYYNKENKGIIGFFGRLLNNSNKFEFSVDNIERQEVEVVWQSEENREILVKNGIKIHNFGYDYGPNAFVVIYQDKWQCIGGFFSQNNNDPNCVKVLVKKEGNLPIVLFEINGEKFEKIMKETN